MLVGHARDPFKTVDTRRSSRRVEVEIAGVIVADSTRSVMLFETYLPTRYYLPREDVRMDLLVPTDTASVCAYKGHARYWSAHVDDTVVTDVAWSYEDPHNYATSVKDMICFFNERVDISVDGDAVGSSTQPVVRLTPCPADPAQRPLGAGRSSGSAEGAVGGGGRGRQGVALVAWPLVERVRDGGEEVLVRCEVAVHGGRECVLDELVAWDVDGVGAIHRRRHGRGRSRFAAEASAPPLRPSVKWGGIGEQFVHRRVIGARRRRQVLGTPTSCRRLAPRARPATR